MCLVCACGMPPPHSSGHTNARHGPGASQSEAPGQQSLHSPGKLVMGHDPRPLGLQAAKYNLMNSPSSLSSLSSGKDSVGD